jgi:glycosyltransferase involved in cell wall biosynthesis/GT2 family glycosyltransferase
VTTVSVVIPVKDAGPLFERVLEGVRSQGPVELVVIDSGSRDRSRELARAAGAQVIEIAPEEFGHGRTRNLGAERTSGDLIAFLTQDAVPVVGWLDALRESFELAERVGAAYGPHLPLEDTSPMIARELTEFFAGFSPNGRPVVQHNGDPAFLSNVNACYARACWEQIRFPDVDYAEDQALGAALLEAGWAKVYNPRAAVYHAHDYTPLEFMRRYFDEYRGLRETIGHVEPISPRGLAGTVRRQVAGDRAWMRAQGWDPAQRARWTARSVTHHTGRGVFSALGSRAGRLPGPLQRALSLERRGPAAAAAGAAGDHVPPAGDHVPPALDRPFWSEIAELSRKGPAPLLEPPPGTSEHERLHIAVVIPPFARGSGGHNSIFQILLRLERMGHTCSIWLHDPLGVHSWEQPAVLRRRIVEEFAPVAAPVFKEFDHWYGADVVVATGWETAYPVMMLPLCRARAYLVHDHECEFFATSALSVWAERTYSFDMFPISGSTWLRDLLEERYGRRGTWFRFGVDHDVYQQLPVDRDRRTVLFYSRDATPRRAVPLGLLALDELWRRRPDVRIVLFGDPEPAKTTFPHENLGIVGTDELARRYNQATVGLCLSLTNYSLIPQEMMACGLPVVDLAERSPEAAFGRDGPVELSEPDPLALADAVEALLDDEQRWARRSEAGLAFAAGASWDAAARQVEHGLREALRQREPSGLTVQP